MNTTGGTQPQPNVENSAMEETEGQKLYGKFNPTGNKLVEEIKVRCAELHDLIAEVPTKGRISAATKTSSQMALLDAQMKAVKLIFLPEGL